MKKLLTLGLLFYLISPAQGQMCPTFSYQAVVRNTSNELVCNENVTVAVAFYNHTTDATPTFTESHHCTTNQNGLLSFLVGTGTPTAGQLTNVTWADAFIRTEFSLSDGTHLSDTTRISAVPFAYFASKIPASAIEEHLGTSQLVSKSFLKDTLRNFITRDFTRDSLMTSATHSYLQEFIISNNAENTFALQHTPTENNSIILFINGICVSASSISLNGATVQYMANLNGGTILVPGDRIQILYNY